MHTFEPTAPLTVPTEFNPTQPFGDSTIDASAFADFDGGTPSTLSPSLLSDLKRFGDGVDAIDLLPALAASVRHGKSLALHLRLGGNLLRVSVFPRAQLFHCETDLCALSHAELAQLQLVRIQPEAAVSPIRIEGMPSDAAPFGQLAPLLWLVAEYGASAALLPEITGRVRYRLAPGFSTHELPVELSAMPLIQRLGRSTVSLGELSEWTVRGPARVSRLLNAIYLQAGLMVLRVSPKADLREGAPIVQA
jgi:hypothetical protein